MSKCEAIPTMNVSRWMFFWLVVAIGMDVGIGYGIASLF